MQQVPEKPIHRPERLQGRLEFPDLAYFELRERSDYWELLGDGRAAAAALYAKLGRSMTSSEEEAEAEAAALLCIALSVPGCFDAWGLSRYLPRPN